MLNRIFSLDVFRGLAIFIMIVVDAPPANIYEILQHAHWEGLTIADVAFPAFIFAMGVSAAVSSSRKIVTWRKIFRRAVLLFVLGIILNETWYIFAYLFNENFTSADFYNGAVEHLRFFGILQRLALTYAAGMAITKFVTSNAKIFAVAFVLLALSSLGFHVYAAENPFDELNNISGAIDLIFPSLNHIYTPTGDPEGLYGTIASTASMLFGFLAGKILIDDSTARNKIFWLISLGTILLLAGGLWSCFDIIAKKIWTAPYALMTSGGSLIVMAILFFILDVNSSAKKISQPLAALGKNPLLMFMASNIAVIFLITVKLWMEIFFLSRTVLKEFISLEFNVLLFVLVWATLWTLLAELLDAKNFVLKL